MNLSFSRGQQLCVGGLVMIMVVCAAIAGLSLQGAVRSIRQQVEMQTVQAQCFTQMAASFSQVGLGFYQQRVEDRFDLPGLLKPLNTIRHLAADLAQKPLTQEEQQHLDQLVTEEKRIRTALHLFATSGVADPSQESTAQVEANLAPIISKAMDQAKDSSLHISTTVKTRNEELIHSLQRTALVLLGGAVLTCLLGIVAYRHLMQTVERPLTAIWTATYELMGGNFAYRLQTAFSGAMGEIADGIDALAHLLETQARSPQPPKPEHQDTNNHSTAPRQPVESPHHGDTSEPRPKQVSRG